MSFSNVTNPMLLKQVLMWEGISVAVVVAGGRVGGVVVAVAMVVRRFRERVSTM